MPEQQVFLAVLTSCQHPRIRAAALFDLLSHIVPYCVRNDAMVGPRNLDPFGATAQQVAAFSFLAVRITAPLAPSPHQAADVEWVVENACCLLRIAADGRRIQLTGLRAPYTSDVKVRCNLDRGGAGSEFG